MNEYNQRNSWPVATDNRIGGSRDTAIPHAANTCKKEVMIKILKTMTATTNRYRSNKEVYTNLRPLYCFHHVL
jgi:hypothetical protein